MRLEIPLDAAEVLDKTAIKTDYPDVWSRYLSDRVVRVSRQGLRATVTTPVGRLDLIILMEYLRCWLKEQDRISDDEVDYAARTLKGSVSHAVLRMAAAMEAMSQTCPHHGSQCPETDDMLVTCR